MRIRAPVLVAPNHPMEMMMLDLAQPGPNEVRVRLVASGVCHSCLDVALGAHDRAPLPIVLGDEGAGVVEDVGASVTLVEPGDHVVLSWAPGCGNCRYCLEGRPILCLAPPPFGFLQDGTTRLSADGHPVHHFGPATYAPHIVVSERAAIPITKQLSLEAAALLGCSVTTGIGSVVNTGAVVAGQSVAVFGCGGVGLNAVQGAVLVGAKPIIAIDPVADRLEAATALGATHTFHPEEEPNLAESIFGVAPDGVDCAVVAVGAAAVVEQAWGTLAPAGTVVVVGNPRPGEILGIEPRSLLMGERKLVGSKYGSANPADEFPRLADLALAGRIKLEKLISQRYPIERANDAFVDLAGGALGRGLIVFDST